VHKPGAFEVMKNSLLSVAEEMKVVLAKTAYSPLLKLAGDYSCGLFDIHGDMVAQGPDIPIHLGSMPVAVRAIVANFPSPKPGDVYIHNDPYQGGSHLPDVNVVSPIFDEQQKLLAYACVRAHWPDIGGPKPGSYAVVTEIFGEGLRIPPVHLYKEGEPNIDVHSLIFNNVHIQDGVKIGIKGFGFIPNKNKNIRTPHIGKVILEEGVEIGSNSTIDRGSLSDTIIGKNTFLDNQVHVAHNVRIGKNCMVAGQVGFAGSCSIGDNVVIGGQAGISGHLVIGNNVKIGGGSGVINDIGDNQQVMGYPAISLREFIKQRKK